VKTLFFVVDVPQLKWICRKLIGFVTSVLVTSKLKTDNDVVQANLLWMIQATELVLFLSILP